MNSVFLYYIRQEAGREKNMMHEEDGKLENSEGERRREKLDAKKGKKKKIDRKRKSRS